MMVLRLVSSKVLLLLLVLFFVVIPVSAVEKPIITSVVIENDTITDGGEIHITVSGTADARVTQGFYSRSNPTGAWGCGFHDIIQSGTNWTGHIRYTVSPQAPSGEYKFSNIRVMDEIEQQSDNWPETVVVIVNNSQSVGKPVVASVTVNNGTIIDGGEIEITVLGTADAKVTQGFYSRSNPTGAWGCGFHDIIQSGTNWTGHIRYTISPQAPSGEYKFSNIRVMDEIEQQSDYWPEIVTVTVNNSQTIGRPVIKSVVVGNETIINGGEVHITISGTADARVTQGFYSRSNPMGAWGSGFHDIIQSGTNWTGHIRYVVSPLAPSGEYRFSNIRVMDEIDQLSDYWLETITVCVDNRENGEITPTPTVVTPTATPTPPPGTDKPVIISATLNQEEFADGGTVILNVTAYSVSPVNWLSSRLDGPKGNIFGGGSGARFTEISSHNWRYQTSYTISPYAPSGNYTWSGIQVENENQEASDYWPAMTFSVQNPLDDDIPMIVSAELNQYEFHDGGTVILNVTARSKAPVNWLSSRLNGPKGNIFGGGCGVRFTEVSPDNWSYQTSYTISPYAPSGNYTWSGIQVENENQEVSQTWIPLTFRVYNQYDDDIPVITSAELNQYEFVGGGVVTLRVVAMSRSPVNWLSSRLDGPKGNIFGGGSGARFTEISPHNWSYHESYTISPYAPQGNYTWSGIQVENENQEASDYWPALTFAVVTVTDPLLSNFTANITAGITPLTVQFTDSSIGDPSAWSWSFGDGVTSTEQHPTHTYTVPGNYTVTLSINSGADTCTKLNHIKVTPVLFGDASEDGRVNQADTLVVLQEVVGIREQPAAGTERFWKTDAHVNGMIEVDDALFIAQYNVGLRDIWFEVL
jgi:PKD repeat protein